MKSSVFPTPIEALGQELAHAQKSHQREIVLFDGFRQGTFGNRFYYRFELPESLFLDAVREVRITIGKTEPVTLTGHITALDSQHLTVSLPYDCGNDLPEIRCSWDYSSCFTPVIHRLALCRELSPILSTLLSCRGDGNSSPEHSVVPQLETSSPTHRTALEKIAQNYVTLVWGPAGTGKTDLLVLAALMYLRAGKKVLFLGATPAIADGVLQRICVLGIERGIDVFASALRLGLPAQDIPAPLRLLHSEEMHAALLREPSCEVHNEALYVKKYWRAHIQDRLRESYYVTLKELRSRLEEKDRQLEQAAQEVKELDAAVTAIQNASMLERMKRGFSKDDLLAAQRKQNEKIASHKRLQALRQAISTEILKIGENGPLSDFETREMQAVLERIAGLGGMEKVEADVAASLARGEAEYLGARPLVVTTIGDALAHPAMTHGAYDVVLVDDAHRIHIPHLFAAASLAGKKFIAGGDPFQVPPAATSPGPAAQEWLGRDIFTHTASARTLNDLFLFAGQHSSWFVGLTSEYAETSGIAVRSFEYFFGESAANDTQAQGGRVQVINTTDLRSECRQYLGRKKILPYNDLQSKKVVDLVKHALVRPGRTVDDVGVMYPFAGPGMYTKLQLRMHGLDTIEVGTPESFSHRCKKTTIFDLTVAGLDYTMRALDDRKIGAAGVIRMLQTVCTSATEDVYILADMSHFQKMYKDRLITQFLLSLRQSTDHTLNLPQALKKFDGLSREHRQALMNGLPLPLTAATRSAAETHGKVDHEHEMRMKIAAKQESLKPQLVVRDYERETDAAVTRVLGLLKDVNLLSLYTGSGLLFGRTLAASQALHRLPHMYAQSEADFRQIMELWNLLIYDMSGGTKPQLVYFSRQVPETRVRWDINTMKVFYSSDVDAVIQEGKHQIAVAVSRMFQESLGKPQPANKTEWAITYLNFLSKLEAYLGWISEQVRK